MAKFLCLFAGLVLAIIATNGASLEPNVQLSLTDKGLDYVNKVLVNNLVKQVHGVPIPPINLNSAGVSLELKNAKVSHAALKSASFGVDSSLLKLHLHMDQLAVGGDYVSRMWFFNSHDTFTVEVKGLDISQRLSIGYNAKGQPVVTNAGCFTKIDSLSPRFGSSFLLNIFAKLAQRAIQPRVEKKICDAITKAIEEKGKVLPSLYPETHQLIGIPCTVVSYPITAQPIVEQDYVDFLIRGEAKSSCRPSSGSSPRQKFVRIAPSRDKMLSIAFSDDFINLLFNQYYEAGMMTVTSSKPNGNSSSNVSIQALRAPVIKTTTNGSVIAFEAKITVNLQASKPPTMLEEIVKFESEILLQEAENKTLSAKLRNLRAKIQPRLGSIFSKYNRKSALQVIQSQMDKVAKTLDESLKNMVPLPLIKEMQLVNLDVLHQQGRVTLQMDISV